MAILMADSSMPQASNIIDGDVKCWKSHID